MQTSYSSRPALARVGMRADSRKIEHIESKILVGPGAAGLGLFRVPGYGQVGRHRGDPGQSYQIPTPPVAVNTTAILASGGASSASIQTLTSTSFNGTYANADMLPSRKHTFIFSSHANWDATNATATYVDADGVTVTETIAIPDAGNATVTSAIYARKLVSFVIPAQSGTSGTFTIGVTVLDTVNIADFQGVLLYSPMQVPYSASYEFGDQDVVNVLRKGACWVEPEDAPVEGADVYVRVSSGTGTVMGSFRSDADSATAVQIVGGIWGRQKSNTLAVIELY